MCSNLEENLVYTRVDLIGLLAAFGGLMYTCRHLGQKLTASAALFDFNSTISRKLYSIDAKLNKEMQKRSDIELTEPEDTLLSNYIDNRTSFYYST